MNLNAFKNHTPWLFLAFILIVSILFILGGILFYNFQKNKIVFEKQNELAAIASLKIEQIEKWRMEHIRDAEILSSIIHRNKLISNFPENDISSKLKQELFQIIKIFIENYDYHTILFFDTTGTVRLVFPPMESISKNNISLLGVDPHPSEISFTDLHFTDDLPGIIHIDVQVPLFSTDKNNKVRIGTILLRINPEKTLYHLIQSWPTPSKSSETLLVSREGDSVLYLNELRHQNNTALKLKLPIRSDLPAARAVSGVEGVFEGLDYRGIPVISFMKKIPDSPWFMVAKVDKKEIYSSLNDLTILSIIITSLIILSFSAISIYFRRNQRIRYLNELNATKDKFFSIVSHDLRSPYSSINGFANLMVEDLDLYKKEHLFNEDLSTIRNYAEIILNSSQNAMDLLKNLTEWSRLNSNRLVFNPIEIDIVAVIIEVIELTSTTAMQKSIVINKNTPSKLKIYADKEMISLVLRNLISNSMKFSNPGGKIEVSVIEKKNEIAVEVKDFGIGINEETIEKLFRIGEKVSTPGTQREYGTGLGLILVKEFISMHGGQVFVKSEVGKYSSFMFTIPHN